MGDRIVYLTEEGRRKLEAELEYLRTVRRQQVAQRLHEALEQADILENPEYDDAKNEQAFVEGRIAYLEQILAQAEIIPEGESAAAGGLIQVGSRVTVVEGEDGPPEVYHIVGSAEADPQSGKISNESPLGRALLGHRVGDVVKVNAPAGELTFRILAVE